MLQSIVLRNFSKKEFTDVVGPEVLPPLKQLIKSEKYYCIFADIGSNVIYSSPPVFDKIRSILPCPTKGQVERVKNDQLPRKKRKG
jgi:hypothetical protein